MVTTPLYPEPTNDDLGTRLVAVHAPVYRRNDRSCTSGPTLFTDRNGTVIQTDVPLLAVLMQAMLPTDTWETAQADGGAMEEQFEDRVLEGER